MLFTVVYMLFIFDYINFFLLIARIQITINTIPAMVINKFWATPTFCAEGTGTYIPTPKPMENHGWNNILGFVKYPSGNNTANACRTHLHQGTAQFGTRKHIGRM